MMDNYDCIVVGGGPAGSTTAALLAQAGRSTLLVERDPMPRYQLRESLMPETYWTLRRLGVFEAVKQCPSTRVADVQFVFRYANDPQSPFFDKEDLRECCLTWQVERAEFDKLLFDRAAAVGAKCLDDTPVQDVLMEGDRVAGVRIQIAGQARDVPCRVLIDATGQQALLTKRLGLPVEDPHVRKAAVWGYYRGARRDPGDLGGGPILLHTFEKRSWFWHIPISDDITSIGVVGDNQYLLAGRGMPAEAFEDELVKCPALVERLMNADLVSKFHVAREFSFTTRRRAGDGWVLVGAAYGFIDPIYSPGVFFAMKTGELAADAIIEGFCKSDFSARQLGRWTEEYDASGQNFEHVERWEGHKNGNVVQEKMDRLILPSEDTVAPE